MKVSYIQMNDYLHYQLSTHVPLFSAQTMPYPWCMLLISPTFTQPFVWFETKKIPSHIKCSLSWAIKTIVLGYLLIAGFSICIPLLRRGGFINWKLFPKSGGVKMLKAGGWVKMNLLKAISLFFFLVPEKMICFENKTTQKDTPSTPWDWRE